MSTYSTNPNLTVSLSREVWVLRVLQHPLECSPRKNGGAEGAVFKINE